MGKDDIFLNTLLSANFENYKFIYLYNKLFISVFNDDSFILFGVKRKVDKLIINNYSLDLTKNGKILLVLFKKYEKHILQLLDFSNKKNLMIGNESEFINIYDKKKLSINDISKNLSFSFLDDYTFRRRSELDFQFEDKSELSIYHSDFECSKCSGPKESFTNFPNFRDGIIDKKYFPNDKKKVKKTFLMTNITDYESIALGGNEKIDDILSNKALIDSYDMISINKTCISIIMGDDIKSVIKYNNIPSEKTFYTDQNIDSGYRTVINYLKNIKLNNINQKNNKILFFGLNKNKNSYEIIVFLKKYFDIEVGNILLPNINRNDLENILSYKLAIFFKGKEIKTQRIFDLYPIDSLSHGVPYSISSLILLYKSILNKYEKNDEIIVLERYVQNLKNINKINFDKAKDITIGFIIYDFHIEQFINDTFRGVNIIETLTDMGFKMQFFVYSEEEYISKKTLLENKIDKVIISKKEKDLDKFIVDKNISLYYSEINNDNRILSKNKQIFSIGDFEYGLEGFFRTFSKIIKKCDKVSYLNNLKIN